MLVSCSFDSELSLYKDVSMEVDKMGASSMGEASGIFEDTAVSLGTSFEFPSWIIEVIPSHDSILDELVVESAHDASYSAL